MMENDFFAALCLCKYRKEPAGDSRLLKILP